MGCYNSTVIQAPAAKVWAALRNFHDVSWAKDVVTHVEKVGEKASDEAGAKRILNGAFQETLLSIDDEAMQFTYSIDDGPEAVSKDNVTGYVGKVKVYPVSADDSSFVLWTSDWESTKNDGVAELCNPIYHALLQELRKHFS